MDRDPLSARSAFIRATKIVNQYSSQLRSLAKRVGDILRGHDVSTPHGAERAAEAIRQYERGIDAWAEAAATHMVVETAARDERSWFRVARTIGAGLKKEIAEAPTGHVMQALQQEQVTLIKSIPREAAERVQKLAREAVANGTRADALAAEIMRTEHVTKSRAQLIAYTETGRANTTLTQARAQHVGSEGYLWRTAEDAAVRSSHRAMDGRFVRWDSPPTLDGLTGHAGALPRCRCFCEPTFAD
jgi:SPP1 gp7 family putative phage head morphogenesis protein